MCFNAIQVTYQSNYNGCDVTFLNGEEEVHLTNEEYEQLQSKIDAVCDPIISHAFADCDEDGYYCGDIDELAEFSTTIAKQVFGDSISVTFREDDLSS